MCLIKVDFQLVPLLLPRLALELHGRMTIDHSIVRCDCIASEREP